MKLHPIPRMTLVVALGFSLGTPVLPQVSPEEHASHHPDEASPNSPSGQEPDANSGMGGGGKGGGGMGGGGMGGMMESMGVPPPKELYPQLMDLPDLPLEMRAEVQAKAHGRMQSGAALLAAALGALSRAAPGDDYRAMQDAVDDMREGLAEFQSGLAAHRALAEGSAPRNVALQWFKREMNLLPLSSSASTGKLSPFHVFSMVVLVVFAATMIWLYFLKMQRARDLLRAIASQGPASKETEQGSIPAASAASGSATGTSGGEDAPALNPEMSPVTSSPPAQAHPTRNRADKWSGLLKVCRIYPETHDIKSLRMVSEDGGALPFSYLPGQFLTLSLELNGRRIKRSYTIASSPTARDFLEITVKREDQGLVSRHLHDVVREGDLLEVKAPTGRFTFTGEQAEGIVLIGGGVGITPMMSVIRYLTDRGWPGAIHLLYSCRTTNDFVFREELEFLQRRNANLNVFATMTREEGTVWMGLKGRLTRDLIATTVPDITGRLVHICGPPPMMAAIKGMLAELGVPDSQVRSEAFGAGKGAKKSGRSASSPAVSPSSTNLQEIQGGASVRFARSGKTAPMPAEETILDVADAIGVEIDSSCRSGTCGACKIALLEGQVSMEVEDGLEPDEKDEGLILACQAKSTGEVVVDV